jgi:hypothetical protein
MSRTDGHYIVYVGDGYVRRYTDDTLPECLRSRLAMILASGDDVTPNESLLKMELYTNQNSPELDEIGWRASQSYFCMVLTRKELFSLRGYENVNDA